MKYLHFSLFLLGFLGASFAVKATEKEIVSFPLFQEDKIYLGGYIKDQKSGEAIVGATVYIEELKKVNSSNQFGYYAFHLPPGNYTLFVASFGYQTQKHSINLTQNKVFNLYMTELSAELGEIVISDESVQQYIRGLEMSKNRLDMKSIKNTPSFLGEADVIRTVLLLPGVSTVGEGASGFNVRGGNVDQNLILMDDAPVFNASHLFGFFSVFNPDLIKEVNLYKGGIPANYGGRTASVLDVKVKDGNTKKFTGQGSLGLIASRLSLGIPLVKDKSALLLAGRFSYPDWAIRLVPDKNVNDSRGNYFEGNGKISHFFHQKHKISLSAYFSQDGFRFDSDTLYSWRNLNAVFKWNAQLSQRLFATLTALHSHFDFQVEAKEDKSEFLLDSRINVGNLKLDMSYQGATDLKMEGGFSIQWYNISPGRLQPGDDSSSVLSLFLQNENAREVAAYLSSELKITKKWALSLGLRYTLYQPTGQSEQFIYEEDIPRRISTIVNTLTFGKGKSIQNFGGFEPRLTLRFSPNENNAIKLSYNRIYQYIHLVSNTAAISPTDFWKSSNRYIPPQLADQVALGFFKYFSNKHLEASVEVFYKQSQNLLDYKEGANLLLNPTLEADILNGKGKSWGIEFYFKKSKGKFNGWLSYTFARSFIQVNGLFREEKINFGKFYPTYFDRPHNLSLALHHQFAKKWRWASNFIINSGRPVTYPVSRFAFNAITYAGFSERNQYRTPVYHRLDFSLTFEPQQGSRKEWKTEWIFTLFNLYGRKNPYSVFFNSLSNGLPRAYRLAVLGAVFPSLTFNYRF